MSELSPKDRRLVDKAMTIGINEWEKLNVIELMCDSPIAKRMIRDRVRDLALAEERQSGCE